MLAGTNDAAIAGAYKADMRKFREYQTRYQGKLKRGYFRFRGRTRLIWVTNPGHRRSDYIEPELALAIISDEYKRRNTAAYENAYAWAKKRLNSATST